MKWVETIKVQAAGNRESAIGKELTALAHDIRRSPECPGLLEAALCSHVSVPGHLAIRLIWDTECPQTQGSLLGLSLAQSLRDFGLVDHSVWIENRRIQEGKEDEKEDY